MSSAGQPFAVGDWRWAQRLAEAAAGIEVPAALAAQVRGCREAANLCRRVEQLAGARSAEPLIA